MIVSFKYNNRIGVQVNLLHILFTFLISAFKNYGGYSGISGSVPLAMTKIIRGRGWYDNQGGGGKKKRWC